MWWVPSGLLVYIAQATGAFEAIALVSLSLAHVIYCIYFGSFCFSVLFIYSVYFMTLNSFSGWLHTPKKYISKYEATITYFNHDTTQYTIHYPHYDKYHKTFCNTMFVILIMINLTLTSLHKFLILTTYTAAFGVWISIGVLFWGYIM
jgi:hypothetical protein